MGEDWAELNQDLLHLISKKLGTFSNLLRFRSVCKQWRIAVDPADLPARLPYLLQPDTTLSATETDTKTHDYQVFSLLSKTTSRIKLPISHFDLKYYHNIVPSMGFVVERSFRLCEPLFLFNPLTGAKFHLPFTNATRHPSPTIYIGLNPNGNPRTVKDDVHMMHYVLDSWICGNEEFQTIKIWQSNNDDIITFRIPLESGPALLEYYKGKLFVNNWKRQETSIYDMETKAEMNIVIPNPREHPMLDLLVESLGDLLGVAISFCSEDTCKFKVYRLEHTDNFEQCRWIELKGIGDRVLFLNKDEQGFCLDTSDFKGFRGNCIYYFNLVVERYEDGRYSCHHRVLRYNMEDRTTEELLNKVNNATWFVPNLSLPPDQCC
ncbi:F-box SKIP23-like protein (DUF295) [Rhynchospora pubera]|uniref:F-box SKIP23-like protein (DUF295) n=1 Tax=Rhynchospora pubera TaxID=906938 RepID=A0AAV8CEE7_9POAL|nr:F-box SKIP23-like protein (DUF295) [Rhynchospora pubera]